VLVAKGVDTFFGIPADPFLRFSMRFRHPGTKMIESRHETSAAFGAVTTEPGKVPAVIATAGPGATRTP
jgi:thiamine pyrophosphate-dependent acetolactate synthase large subunit-like protein